MDELKKCPFCGGIAKVINYDADDNKDVFSVECAECGVIIEYFDTEKEAIKKWNHRI